MSIDTYIELIKLQRPPQPTFAITSAHSTGLQSVVLMERPMATVANWNPSPACEFITY